MGFAPPPFSKTGLNEMTDSMDFLPVEEIADHEADTALPEMKAGFSWVDANFDHETEDTGEFDAPGPVDGWAWGSLTDPDMDIGG